MKLRFACPVCNATGQLSGSGEWQCPGCDHLLQLSLPEGDLHVCTVCGNQELYRKKDFPHWLGLTILAAACLGSVVPYALHQFGWTWAILIGSALLDGVLYLLVGDVSVCYRCGAEYRGASGTAGHPPFDLGVAERYRQERIRREQLQVNKKTTG